MYSAIRTILYAPTLLYSYHTPILPYTMYPAPPSLSDLDFITSIGIDEFFTTLSNMNINYLDYPMNMLLEHYIKHNNKLNNSTSNSSGRDSSSFIPSITTMLNTANIHPG